MRIFGIIGRPLEHSFSASYFAAKFKALGLADECRYYNFELERLSELTSLLGKYPDLEGFNVTIPYKRDIVPWLDFVSEEAHAIGAVNCVRVVDGKLWGYNTDAHGFTVGLKALLGEVINGQESGLSSGKRPAALVLGTGGASCAVRYVLEREGIDYKMVSRGGGEFLSYDELTPEVMADHKLIVNTTPLGTYPAIDGKPDLPYDAIGEGHFLYDLVYNPPVTAFLAEGRRRGATTLNGETMLREQAEKSWQIWTGPPTTDQADDLKTLCTRKT